MHTVTCFFKNKTKEVYTSSVLKDALAYIKEKKKLGKEIESILHEEERNGRNSYQGREVYHSFDSKKGKWVKTEF